MTTLNKGCLNATESVPICDFTATAGVIILDVNSGQKVSTYRVSDAAAQSIRLSGTWSPNGKYSGCQKG